MQQQITYEYNRTALPSNATSINVLLLTWKWNVMQIKASIGSASILLFIFPECRHEEVLVPRQIDQFIAVSHHSQLFYCVSVELLWCHWTSRLQVQLLVQSHQIAWRRFCSTNLLYAVEWRSRQPNCHRWRRLSNWRHFVSDRQASQLGAEDPGTCIIVFTLGPKYLLFWLTRGGRENSECWLANTNLDSLKRGYIVPLIAWSLIAWSSKIRRNIHFNAFYDWRFFCLFSMLGKQSI